MRLSGKVRQSPFAPSSTAFFYLLLGIAVALLQSAFQLLARSVAVGQWRPSPLPGHVERFTRTKGVPARLPHDRFGSGADLATMSARRPLIPQLRTLLDLDAGYRSAIRCREPTSPPGEKCHCTVVQTGKRTQG